MTCLKRLLSLLLLILNISVAFAHTPPDSLRTKWINGKKFILHKVVSKEDWTTLSEMYQCTVEELRSANNGISTIKPNQIVQIPIPSNLPEANPKSQRYLPDTTKISNQMPEIVHEVKRGETLFSISRKYGKTVTAIKELNGINEEGIQEGQILLIQKSTAMPANNSPNQAGNPIKVTSKPMTGTTDSVVQTTKTNEIKPQEQTESIYTIKPTKSIITVKTPGSTKPTLQITETGMASWITDRTAEGKFYALHRTAPPGTIIKVINSTNQNYVFVKVIGSLPDSTTPKSVIIKLSRTASAKLGFSETDFQAEISYALTE